MRKRGISIVLVLTLVLAAGALIQDFRFDASLGAERASQLAMERDFGSIDATIAAVRGSQTGYVAAGQVPASWMSKATERFDNLESALTARKAAARTKDAIARYDAAFQALSELRSVDRKARDRIDQADRAKASELILLDAEDASTKLAAEVAAAHQIEQKTSTQELGRTGTMRLAMNGAAMLFVVVIAVYFGRASTILGARPPSSTAQMFRDLPPAVRNGSSSTSIAPTATAQQAAAASQSASSGGVVTSGPLVQRPAALAAAAELCVDLARLLDGRDVPALLERASSVLDAKGIMIWSVDADAGVLRPSLCHGYSERVLRKLRPLPIGDENITSQALRSLQPQTMTGAGPGDSAAIAVPLISGAGCVGVMAAEIRNSRPHGDVVALARIIAAQFTTLVAPADAALGEAAQA